VKILALQKIIYRMMYDVEGAMYNHDEG